MTLKGLLLDQSFAAGVGNWMADEVLYQARLDPRRPAASLAPAEVASTPGARSPPSRAARCAVDADKERFPRVLALPPTAGDVGQGARTARGERIEFLTVAGRTTAWVPGRAVGGTRR